jgi:hypothetical protein
MAAMAAPMLIAAVAHAHHGPYGQFDLDNRVDFIGTVVTVEWKNPHALLLVAAELNGRQAIYRIELKSLRQLVRRGWQGDELKPGDPVHIVNAALDTTGDSTLVCCARIYDLAGHEFFTTSGQLE